jgi:hypothetical protein
MDGIMALDRAGRVGESSHGCRGGKKKKKRRRGKGQQLLLLINE